MGRNPVRQNRAGLRARWAGLSLRDGLRFRARRLSGIQENCLFRAAEGRAIGASQARSRPQPSVITGQGSEIARRELADQESALARYADSIQMFSRDRDVPTGSLQCEDFLQKAAHVCSRLRAGRLLISDRRPLFDTSIVIAERLLSLLIH